MAQFQDQEFVEYVAKALVNKPEAVKVERTIDEMGVLITLHVDQTDMGYIIGRQGATARAFRTLLRTVGAKNNARVNMKIYEPEGSQRPMRAPMGAMGGMGAAAPVAAAPIDTSAVDDLAI